MDTKRCYVLFAMSLAFFCVNITAAQPGPAFSSLSEAQKLDIREMVKPPVPSERYGCYSTPMYYLMHKGYAYKGNMDSKPDDRVYPRMKGKQGPDYGSWQLDRNRPDWQEAMIRDWAELGMNNTHFNIVCENQSLDLPPSYLKSVKDFVNLSFKYGIKVGVRLDALGGTKAWEMQPDNPKNQVEEYLTWTKTIAKILKGKTAYYVLGDEMTLHKDKPGLGKKQWTPEKYLDYFKKVSGAIKEVDPDAKVSMFGASSGEWFNVLYLLEIGYAQYGDAVAINYYNYSDVPKFFDDAANLAPELLFLSNGVGYCSAATAQPRYPEWDPYGKSPTEEAHGKRVAKNMFAWWDLGADTAPYYITLRNWEFQGKVYPRWYGFFGFQDFVVDENDNMTIRRYPAWYAFQAVAHTFYNRDQFKKPRFDVSSSEKLTMFRAYEHKLPRTSELVMMLWNDKGTVNTTVNIASKDYKYATRISTFNYNNFTDAPYNITADGIQINLEVGRDPIMIRLINSCK